jgi:chromosome segregation ATPase
LDKVREVDELEEDDKDEHKSMYSKEKFGIDKKADLSSRQSFKDSYSQESSLSEEFGRKENYERQLEKLGNNIEDLKREVEEIQRKIGIIYEFRKSENRDDRNYYKESNINESTYTDSLTSAANLYNELNTHKRKLEADLQKYNQSIEFQEERKKEVYKILMNYKEELISNAEYRKGTKIPRAQIEEWLSTEKFYEDEIRRLRIENIKNTLELNRLNKELKKMEEYFEGLHLIDFEQLKIENNVS